MTTIKSSKLWIDNPAFRIKHGSDFIMVQELKRAMLKLADSKSTDIYGNTSAEHLDFKGYVKSMLPDFSLSWVSKDDSNGYSIMAVNAMDWTSKFDENQTHELHRFSLPARPEDLLEVIHAVREYDEIQWVHDS